MADRSDNLLGRRWYEMTKATLNADTVRYIDNLLAPRCAISASPATSCRTATVTRSSRSRAAIRKTQTRPTFFVEFNDHISAVVDGQWIDDYPRFRSHCMLTVRRLP
jgi:hypothetical protein